MLLKKRNKCHFASLFVFHIEYMDHLSILRQVVFF